MEGLSEEERNEARTQFEDALGHMKAFGGDNSEYIIMLKEKMQDQGLANLDAIHHIITLLTMLLQGTEEEQQMAREHIDKMVSKPGHVSEAARVKQQEAIDFLENHEGEINDLIDNDLTDLDDEKQDSAEALGQNTSSALIEKRNSALGDPSVGGVVKGIAFIIIVWLVVAAVVSATLMALSIVISFSLVILVGCGAYRAGENDGQLDMQGTFDCFLQFLTWPVIQGAKGIKWVWQEYAPEEFQ